MKGSKTLIMILGVLAVVGFAYMTFFSDEPAADNLMLEDAGSESGANVGTELILLLNQLKRLELNNRIFSSASFTSLRDYTREIDILPVGRNNPFAPIGRDTFFVPTTRQLGAAAGASAPAATSTATSTRPVSGASPAAPSGAR